MKQTARLHSAITACHFASPPILSIRQPWAWLICHAGKDIENRCWITKFRGRFLIHASTGMTRREYEEAHAFALDTLGPATAPVRIFAIPPFEALERGGIVGQAEITGCVDHSVSPWFSGPLWFVLANAKPLPFHPCKGSLGFFHVLQLPPTLAQGPP